MKKRQNDAKNFAQDLIRKGHKCICYLESFQYKLHGAIMIYVARKINKN
jgi:hypothetical protein